MASDIFAEIDTSELMDAMNLYEQVTKKDGSEVVNKFAKELCFEAARETNLAKLPAINKWDPSKEGKSKTTKKRARLMYALAAKDGWRKGGGIGKEAKKRFGKRKSAKGFARAIWYTLAHQLGASLRGEFKLKKARARKATEFTLAAKIETGDMDDVFFNHMKKAIQDAIPKVIAEKKKFLLDQMQKRAKQFSGR